MTQRGAAEANSITLDANGLAAQKVNTSTPFASPVAFNDIPHSERAKVWQLGANAAWRPALFLEIPGKMGWKARYFKEVDAAERTLRFWQAIYDSHNRIVEIHEKFPVDRGHQSMEDSQQ